MSVPVRWQRILSATVKTVVVQLLHLELVVDRSLFPGVKSVTSPGEAALCVAPFIANRAAECMVVLALDTKRHPVGVGLVGAGSIDSAPCSVADVLRFAFSANAASIVLAHNHPSGDLEPSEPDWQLTEYIAAAAAFMHVALEDHLIIGYGGHFCSMRARDQRRFLVAAKPERPRLPEAPSREPKAADSSGATPRRRRRP
jgi:DNA repair protein RadC